MKRLRLFATAVLALTACIDFQKKLDACKAGEGPCSPELLQTTDSGLTFDAGPTETDAGADCTPACAKNETCFNSECLGQACDQGSCGDDQVCLDGRCTAPSCLQMPCDARFTCVSGTCVPRSCGAATCQTGFACFDGGCVDVTCVGVTCDGGRCVDGSCRFDPCTGKVAGQTCAMNKVCSPTGQCVACQASISCTQNPNDECFEGLITCATGAPVCVDGAQAEVGTLCGSANHVCNSAGACVSCQSGQACSNNPSKCREGVISCTTGAPRCIDGAPKGAGASCGNSQVCDGHGFCGDCTAGEACDTNPSACYTGTTSCSTGGRVCVDDSALLPGASCGADAVCDANHVCSACTAQAACFDNPGAPCLAGTTGCDTGHPVCVDTSTPLSKTYHRDADSDGFGDANVTKVVCGPHPATPAGYVEDATDCCDGDANAKPGQTAYFIAPNACSTFDYDCSGSTEFKFATGFTGCTFDTVCAANGLGTPCGAAGTAGWGLAADDALSRDLAWVSATSIPACGAKGTFVNGCGTVSDCGGTNCACGVNDACQFDVTHEVQQPCR